MRVAQKVGMKGKRWAASKVLESVVQTADRMEMKKAAKLVERMVSR